MSARAQSAPMFKNFKNSNENEKKTSTSETANLLKKSGHRPITTVNFKRGNNTPKY